MIDPERRLRLLEGAYELASAPWELAFVACARGRFEEAIEWGRPLLTVDEPDVRAQARLTVGSALRQLARYEEADSVERADDLDDPIGRAHLSISRAANAVGLAEPARSIPLLDDAEAALRDTNGVETRRARIRTRWVRAEVALCLDDPDRAAQLLQPARHESLGWPRHEAKTALFAGVAARVGGREPEARDLLREASRIATQIGAAAIATVAERLLAEPGPWPRAAGTPTPHP